MNPGLRTAKSCRPTGWDLTLLTVAAKVESAMSTKTIGPEAEVDQWPTAEITAEAGAEPLPTGDGLPFECAEFGVEGFLPHLDAASDG